jgi:hypothetical protein
MFRYSRQPKYDPACQFHCGSVLGQGSAPWESLHFRHHAHIAKEARSPWEGMRDAARDVFRRFSENAYGEGIAERKALEVRQAAEERLPNLRRNGRDLGREKTERQGARQRRASRSVNVREFSPVKGHDEPYHPIG